VHPADIEILAKTLIHEFAPVGWVMAWNNRKSSYGRCCYKIKTIELSRHLIPLCTPEQIRTVIMHEIAHSLTPRAGHGRLWKIQMIRFGLRPDRCAAYDIDHAQYSNWKATCWNCGKESFHVRKPRADKSCGKCSRGRYTEKYKLTFLPI
jgi:predicted SprT family Zn-dependent metalloprotease